MLDRSSSYHFINVLYTVGAGACGMVIYDKFAGLARDYIGCTIATSWFVVMLVNGWVRGKEKDLELKGLDIIDRRQGERDEAAYQRTMPKQVPDTGFLGLLKVGGVPYRQPAVYTQTVAPVRMDHERNMAAALVAMKQAGFPMNISETYWIRDKHWPDGPESFRVTRGKWEYYNIVGKRGNASNSRYEIQNERGVELIASGSLKLPPPPS